MRINGLTAMMAAIFLALPANSQPRQTLDLSYNDWSITLDREAQWENDTIYLPPVNIAELPVNIPSGGWEMLGMPDKTGIHLPATVEGHLWGWNGTSFGVTGDYMGVSWFETRFDVPQDWKGRVVNIYFESARLRAEVFINHKLAGYDVVGGTPFTFNISDYLEYGGENVLSVRITDPFGNYEWRDGEDFWGKYTINRSHAFGGIGAKVEVTATDRLYITDVFVMNNPDPRKITVEVSAENGKAQGTAPLAIDIREKSSGKVVCTKKADVRLQEGENIFKYDIRVPSAKLWSPSDPNLYYAEVSLGQDSFTRRFGFRWFGIKESNGERHFQLNGKRIVLRSAISWSFWPEQGLYPGDELARKQIETAKALGLNMLNFHRAIGYTEILDYADELGLLYYEEPGANAASLTYHDGDNSFSTYALRDEKFARLVKRDRSHPSLIIYNMHNERKGVPTEDIYKEMIMGHRLDPSRIKTYTSTCCHEVPEVVPSAGDKTHLLPFDFNFYDSGWWDKHNAGAHGVYPSYHYKSPTDYRRYSGNKSEIVFWGEEGAIGTAPRLQLIYEDIMKRGVENGWDTEDYVEWYRSYDRFLDEQGFRKAFPTVDDLTVKMGNVAYNYQGRITQQIRMGNVADGYCTNGWESEKIENHSGIVDCYRNPKGDPSIMAYYNRPLYLAVNLTQMVLPTGAKTSADIYIINEEDVKGDCTLDVSLVGPDGKVAGTFSKAVKVTGGDTYGELLATGIEFAVEEPGYSKVIATLTKKGAKVCEGKEDIFAVRLNTDGIPALGSVADSSGFIRKFLDAVGVRTEEYTGGIPAGDYLVIGKWLPAGFSNSHYPDFLRWVSKGHTLIIVDNPEQMAQYLSDKDILDYRGSVEMRQVWFGGNFFNKEHPVFEGLPQDCVFDWEYQCLNEYDMRKNALRCANGETLVGVAVDHRHEIFSALSLIKVGRGQVIITSLNIPFCLSGTLETKDESQFLGELEIEAKITDEESKYAKVVGRQLFLNMLKLSAKQQ